MGRDIYMCTEIKLESKNWVSADDYYANPYYPRSFDGHRQAYILKPIYDVRDRTLFSILCEGAGYDLNPSISPPKGMPLDCCNRIKQDCRSFGEDEFMHSYLTLKEIEEHAKKLGHIRYSGYVENEEVNQVLNGVPPTSWSKGVGHPENYNWLEWDVDEKPLQQIIASLQKILAEKSSIFLLPYKLSKECIRIVFWFYD